MITRTIRPATRPDGRGHLQTTTGGGVVAYFHASSAEYLLMDAAESRCWLAGSHETTARR